MVIPSSHCPLPLLDIYTVYHNLVVVNACLLLTVKECGRWVTTVQSPVKETLNPFLAHMMVR